jgi:hypothetical protein
MDNDELFCSILKYVLSQTASLALGIDGLTLSRNYAGDKASSTGINRHHSTLVRISRHLSTLTGPKRPPSILKHL